jgi:hypothetical protein
MSDARERLLGMTVDHAHSGRVASRRSEAESLLDKVIAAEARSAEVYVLAMSVGPEAVSTDLELLQRTAEKKEEWAASEFEWRRDPYIGWTERLQLHYVSKSTGRWNKSGHYIDRVKVLEKAGQAQSAE